MNSVARGKVTHTVHSIRSIFTSVGSRVSRRLVGVSVDGRKAGLWDESTAINAELDLFRFFRENLHRRSIAKPVACRVTVVSCAAPISCE